MTEGAGSTGPVAYTLLLVLHSGSAGGMVSSTLRPECVEGLLSYARLFFAQPHSGKLSTLAATGRKVHTVTNWDPGQQSIEAIVQGLADWKAPEGDAGFNIKSTLMEVTQFLYQTTGNCIGRLMVILPQDSSFK